MRKNKKSGKAALIVRFLKGNMLLLITGLLFSMLHTALNTLTPQIMRVTTDSVIGEETPALPQWLLAMIPQNFGWEELLWVAAIAILLVSALAGICSYIGRVNTAKGCENFVKSLRDTLFAHIQKLPFAWHTRHQTGEIIQRCTADVEVVRNFVTNQLLEVFRTLFLVAVSLGIMFSMDVSMTLVALAFIPIIILYSGFFYSKIAKRFQKADEAEGVLSSVVQENLTGVRVVRAFGREQYEIERFDEKNEGFASLWIRLGKLMSAYWATGDLITGLQITTVTIWGVICVVNGTITLGEFLAFLSYNSSMIWPIRGLGRILSEMSKAGVSIDRVGYILHAEEEDMHEEEKQPDLSGDIAFSHVSFSYEQETPILQDLNFTIPAGTTFAILGGTGSGKSTLMHLLNRLYDLPEGCGTITIGGRDIKTIDRQILRQNIGMVLQEPFLFSRTISENICMAADDADTVTMRRAAETACIDQAIVSFPHGYDTIVGERGVTLSGGQKQRVAIARMLIQNTPIMVFDDSFSAIDSETDAEIRRALRENRTDSTVILISHRVTTLMQADCILVLEDGKIAEIGSHEQLLARDGTYKKIFDIQMSSDDRALIEEGVL